MTTKYEQQGSKVSQIGKPGGGHSSSPEIMNDYPAVRGWFDEHLTRSGVMI
jgi:hypothetical protein